MRLMELISWEQVVNVQPMAPEVDIQDIASNPEKAQRNSLLFCLSAKDSTLLQQQILQNLPKIAAIVYDDSTQGSLPPQIEIPRIKVKSARATLGPTIQRFYGNPSLSMYCVGVTGTNGKSSVVQMSHFLWIQSGFKAARIGTLGVLVDDLIWDTGLTTPGPIELGNIFHKAQKKKISHLAMEVSSHALHQYRVDGIHFDAACFTNFSRDHLDYHETMENYFHAKSRLFSYLISQSRKSTKLCILNGDDPWIRQVQVPQNIETVWIGTGLHHDIKPQILSESLEGIKFLITTAKNQYQGFLPIIGGFQIWNLTFALKACDPHESHWHTLIQKMASFPGIPGRLQKVSSYKGAHVFIDYAHTPDALEKSLTTLRRLKDKNSRLWVIFGCGGERDQGKRPLMGQVAENLADQIVLTSDNPRFEKPHQIIQMIEQGIQNKSKIRLIQSDRKTAIEWTLNQIESPEDILLIAGKGYENYQEIEGVKHPFSDFDIVTNHSNFLQNTSKLTE